MTPSRARRGAALLVGALAVVVSLLAASPAHGQDEPVEPGAQRVVVLSDSIAAGTRGRITEALEQGGWTVAFDAEQNRTTYAAAPAAAALVAEPTDTVVLSLGSNDDSEPDEFRARVESVMSQLVEVRRVFWLSLHEVREFYPVANQVLREAAAAHENLTVLDWHAVAETSDVLTAGDGLHLTGAGAAAMAELVGAAVLDQEPADAPTTAAPAPTDAPITEPSPVDAGSPESSAEPAAAEDADGAGWHRWLGWTVGGFALFVAALAAAGGILAIWSLWSTRQPRPRRGTDEDGDDDGDVGRRRSEHHPAVRAQLRAQRIAAAREAADL